MKPFFLLSLLLIAFTSFSQKDLLTAQTRDELVKNLDSAMHTVHFLTSADAETIIGKTVILKDSAYKFSSGVLRYNYDFIAKYVDSTSKGRITVNFEQYKDTAIAKANYEFIRDENKKDKSYTALPNTGTDAYMTKDYLDQPFIMILKDNKIYKFRMFYLSSEKSTQALLQTAQRISSGR